MKLNNTLVIAFLSVLMVGCFSDPTTAERPSKVEPTTCGDVRNLSRVGEVYLAGQPTPEDFPLLKELGIKTVINLRRSGETDLDEKALVENNGMTYVHIPWSGPDQLTDARLDAMRQALRDRERPLLLHCGSANRVGPAWIAYRVLDEGATLDHAIAEAKQIGMRTPEYETIAVRYIESR
ncbi:MAG: protein tyrosine phosphatase family protein [Planctomycetota bacterium]